MATEEAKDGEPRFERYRVVSRVRSGPVTDLYEAEQLALGRRVFIKALARGILPTSPFAAALEREARLLTALDHQNVIRLQDFVREEGTMWLVLEHVDGVTLEDLLSKKGALSPAGACAIAHAVAEALEHAHGRGVVHRDVQPRNVLVSRTGSVKLANFAAAADERLPTAPELLEGTDGFGVPAYMSPEQLLGEPEDPRSDLFSLGTVLYQMLTGRRPFDAPDDRAASHRIRHDPVPSLVRAVPQVSGSLDRAVRHCLEKLPSDRIGTAGELARLLLDEIRAAGFRSSHDALVAELERLGVAGATGRRRDSVRMPRARRAAPTIRTAFSGYLVAFVLVVVGGFAIQYGTARARTDRAPRGGARLELVPNQSGSLRVVADPWAHVVVDGERIDTTPFARPIPLAAGVHYVRFEHPAAPTERRTVTIASGETVLLDVKMDVARPKAARPQDRPPVLTDPSTP